MLPAAILLLLGSVSLNVVLGRKVQSFRQFLAVKAVDGFAKVGTAVPPIAAKRLGGQSETISFDTTDKQTVLYVFTPSCKWCARNMDNFKTLAERESPHYRFIGVSLSDRGLTEYVAKNELKPPIYSGLSLETRKTYKLGSTPQTIVISPDGKVLEDWVGAYVGDQKSQVEAFFQVILPGLR